MSDIGACGHPFGDDFAWPSRDGRTVCYPCFEAEADEAWWQMMTALSEADVSCEDGASANSSIGPGGDSCS